MVSNTFRLYFVLFCHCFAPQNTSPQGLNRNYGYPAQVEITLIFLCIYIYSQKCWLGSHNRKTQQPTTLETEEQRLFCHWTLRRRMKKRNKKSVIPLKDIMLHLTLGLLYMVKNPDLYRHSFFTWQLSLDRKSLVLSACTNDCPFCTGRVSFSDYPSGIESCNTYFKVQSS